MINTLQNIISTSSNSIIGNFNNVRSGSLDIDDDIIVYGKRFSLSGFNTLVKGKQLAVGEDKNAPLGGVRLQFGLDLNRNNNLDPSEISATYYLKNGVSSSVNITSLNQDGVALVSDTLNSPTLLNFGFTTKINTTLQTLLQANNLIFSNNVNINNNSTSSTTFNYNTLNINSSNLNIISDNTTIGDNKNTNSFSGSININVSKNDGDFTVNGNMLTVQNIGAILSNNVNIDNSKTDFNSKNLYLNNTVGNTIIGNKNSNLNFSSLETYINNTSGNVCIGNDLSKLFVNSSNLINFVSSNNYFGNSDASNKNKIINLNTNVFEVQVNDFNLGFLSKNDPSSSVLLSNNDIVMKQNSTFNINSSFINLDDSFLNIGSNNSNNTNFNSLFNSYRNSLSINSNNITLGNSNSLNNIISSGNTYLNSSVINIGKNLSNILIKSLNTFINSNSNDGDTCFNSSSGTTLSSQNLNINTNSGSVKVGNYLNDVEINLSNSINLNNNTNASNTIIGTSNIDSCSTNLNIGQNSSIVFFENNKNNNTVLSITGKKVQISGNTDVYYDDVLNSNNTFYSPNNLIAASSQITLGNITGLTNILNNILNINTDLSDVNNINIGNNSSLVNISSGVSFNNKTFVGNNVGDTNLYSSLLFANNNLSSHIFGNIGSLNIINAQNIKINTNFGNVNLTTPTFSFNSNFTSPNISIGNSINNINLINASFPNIFNNTLYSPLFLNTNGNLVLNPDVLKINNSTNTIDIGTSNQYNINIGNNLNQNQLKFTNLLQSPSLNQAIFYNPTNGSVSKGTLSSGDTITSIYGNGQDGDIVINGVVTLTRDMFYNNLTINSGSELITSSYRIFVKETLTLDGKITNNGGDAPVRTRAQANSTIVSTGSYTAGAGSSAGAGFFSQTSTSTTMPRAGFPDISALSTTSNLVLTYSRVTRGRSTETTTQSVVTVGGASTSTIDSVSAHDIISISLNPLKIPRVVYVTTIVGGAGGNACRYIGEPDISKYPANTDALTLSVVSSINDNTLVGGGGGGCPGVILISCKNIIGNGLVQAKGGNGSLALPNDYATYNYFAGGGGATGGLIIFRTGSQYTANTSIGQAISTVTGNGFNVTLDVSGGKSGLSLALGTSVANSDGTNGLVVFA